MKVLILEDNEARIKYFVRNLSGFKITYTEIAKEVIYKLDKQKWDILFLDHDLGETINDPTNNKNTGSEVARWLSEHPKKQPKLIILHTLNIRGQKYMKSLLPKSIILPFAWIKLTSKMLVDKEAIKLLELMAKQQLGQMQI